MNPSIERLLTVQDVDSEMLFVRESLRLRPSELEEDRGRVRETGKAIEDIVHRVKQLRIESDRRELDVRKADAEIEKLNVVLNQARSNQEYTITKEQIKRHEELRGRAEEEVLEKLTLIDGLEEERKGLVQRLAVEEKALQKKSAEVEEIVRELQTQLGDLERRRADLVQGVDKDHLKMYDRVLARHNNFAIARVEDQICQGCFISITSQDVNLLMQGQFVQCRSCSRLLYLPG